MGKPLKEMQILIVDDNAQTVILITMVLEGIGVNGIVTASNGETAVKMIETAGAAVDLVICDRNMPGMSGTELLETVRGSRPDLPFIMITGDASPEFVEEAEKLGISGLIKKPFPPQEVEEKIRAVADAL